MPPIPVQIICWSGLVEDAGTAADADRIAVRLLADALAAGWSDRPDGLYCPRCVAELFRPLGMPVEVGGLNEPFVWHNGRPVPDMDAKINTTQNRAAATMPKK